MKRYLNKNTLKIKAILFLVLFGTVISSSNLLAQSKVEYYKRLFGREFGFTVYEENEKVSSEKGYLSSNSDKGYLVLLSSDISEEENLEILLEKNEKIVLICDTSYSAQEPFVFSCDKSNVYSDSITNIEGFLKTTDQQNIDLYVVPENLLISFDKRAKVQNYFEACRKSDDVSLVSEDERIISVIEQKIDEVKGLLKTTTFETFGIAVSMFLIVSVSFGLLKFLSREDKKKFDSCILKKLLVQISEYLISYQWIMIYSLIIIFLMYIPIIITLGVKDGKGASLGYFITYSLDTLKITNLNSYINQGDYFRVVIFFYNFIFLIIISILFIPSLIKTVLIASSKIGNAKLKPEIIKYAVSIIAVLSIAVSSFFDILDFYRFLIFMVVVLFFIIINNLKYKTFDYKYSLREKMIFISTAILIIFVGFFARVKGGVADSKYKEEDLIGTSDSIVMLPYSKQLGVNILVRDHSISIPGPVFVDRYLVYSPIHSRIENKNVSEFKDSGSFYIQNGEIEDIVLAVYNNEELSEALISESPTNLFRINNFENKFGQDGPKIQLTFSCIREDLGIDKIKTEFYYLFRDEEVQKSDETLLYFPGCSKVGEPETFIVEFKPPYTESEYFFISLVDVLSSDIESIKIMTLDMVIEPTYYLNSEGYGILSSGGQTDSSRPTVINYIFGESYDLSFDLNPDSEGKFNISQPINELIRQGVLKERFLIWSTKRYLPIRSD